MKLDKLTVKQIAEIDACTRCGNCLDLCSAYLGSSDIKISPKKKMEKLKKAINIEYGFLSKLMNKKLSKEEIEALSTAAFACTMCSRCEVDCHINIKLQDIWLKLREALVDEGQYPEILDIMRKRLNAAKNVSFDSNEGRADWIKAISEKPVEMYIKDKAEVIYFAGCVSSFSPRVFKIPRSVLKILEAAEIDFGLLGEDEWCCGFPLITSGFKDDFYQFAKHNIERVNKTGAAYLITSCPSCYHMWKHVYPDSCGKSGMSFEVLHTVQYLNKLAKEQKIKLNPVEGKITYHDPCDLGRNSGIYIEPRQLIQAIPGIKFLELEKNRQYATCCGGGGNVESIDNNLSASIAGIKAREIISTGADMVITACQQCVRTIAQALKKEKSKIKVMDITELVLASISQDLNLH